VYRKNEEKEKEEEEGMWNWKRKTKKEKEKKRVLKSYYSLQSLKTIFDHGLENN